MAGDDGPASPISKSHFLSGDAGPRSVVLPVCCKSWWNMGQGDGVGFDELSLHAATAAVSTTMPSRGGSRDFILNLEVNLEFPSHRSAQAVEKLAEVRAAEIVLHIAWIRVIRNVENDHTRTRRLVPEWHCETL